MAIVLVLLPMLAGLGAWFVRPDRARRLLLVGTALLHLVLTVAAWSAGPSTGESHGMIGLDGAGLLFLTITSVLFTAAAVYAVGYLGREQHTPARRDFEEGTLFANAPEATFTACLLLFLSMMTLVAVSRHFGLIWVAIEATTLASAPLIYYHRHHRSLEATWKYLLICSVGIALALLGNFFLAISASVTEGAASLQLDDMIQRGPQLNPDWLKAAFILLLVGYGTKMGLAPMHTWLPDAHSEAPSMVSALLSGALLNCAFLGILRAQQVCVAAGLGGFGRELLIVFGLVSMGFAAVFIVGQADFKRMLAYSSVEHVGILALGVGLGGAGAFGSMLHAVNHSLTKAMLFLVAGNILAAYETKSVSCVRGIRRVLPISGVLWLVGFLAITGSPPFGMFASEFTILKAALDGGHVLPAIMYLLFLAIIFIGMATNFLAMSHGSPSEGRFVTSRREPWTAVVPPIALAVLILMLGLYLPASFRESLAAAARCLGGL